MSAWTRIQHIEVPSAQANIEFTSIPQTYTDLVVVHSIRSSHTPNLMDGVGLRFNGSTSSYTGRRLLGNGSSASSDTIATNTASVGMLLVGFAPANTTGTTFGNGIIYIPNYSGSTNKSVSADSVGETNAVNSEQMIHAGLWSVTDAITSITLVPYYSGSNFVQYSSATLYGVLKGSSGGVTVS